MESTITETKVLDNYIGGAWTPAHATELLDVDNPATGEPLFFTRKKTVTSRYFSSGQSSGAYFVEGGEAAD
jgi:hypothetical protein